MTALAAAGATGMVTMGQGMVAVAIARAVVAQTGGWEVDRMQQRLRSLMASGAGGVVSPTLLAVGRGMARSMGQGWGAGLLVAAACALGAGGALGLRLDARRGVLEGEAALPLAAAGAAVGVGILTLLARVARASLVA